MYALSSDRLPETNGERTTLMGKLFVAVLLLVVAEGALRKWGSPALTNPLVLLRDLLALCGILWAVKERSLQLSRPAGQALLVWALVVVIWGFVQTLIIGGSPTVFIVGARFWLLYLGFAYAAGLTLSERDFRTIMTVLMCLVVLMAPLAVVQHYLPPSSFLNRQVDNDTSVFLVTSGIVRTTGTFSFTAGYTAFLALVTPFVLSSLGPGIWRHRSRWLAFASLLSLGAATIVSGSRGAIMMFGLVLTGYALASLFMSRVTTKFSSVVRVAVVLALLLSGVYVFPRAVTATETRFADAARSESFSGRIASIFLGEQLDVYDGAPLIGYGIGEGSNFAGVQATGRRAFLLAETEIARTILEGGFLGFAFVLAKVIVSVVGVWEAVRVSRRTGSPLPLLLWVTTAIALLSWALLGQLTINAIGFMLLALAIACLRLPLMRR